MLLAGRLRPAEVSQRPSSSENTSLLHPFAYSLPAVLGGLLPLVIMDDSWTYEQNYQEQNTHHVHLAISVSTHPFSLQRTLKLDWPDFHLDLTSKLTEA